jgi:sulfatase modifying factor 1
MTSMLRTATDDLTELTTGGLRWVPGRTFAMGSDRHYPEEAPAHPVTVDGFWIDAFPVTNRQFASFVKATGHVTFAAEQAVQAREIDVTKTPDRSSCSYCPD